jgi:outer membrane protein assembly factor BamB
LDELSMVARSTAIVLLAVCVDCAYLGAAEPSVVETEGATTSTTANSSHVHEDWPCWRGLNGDNHSDSQHPPVEWSATNNVLWKAAVPGIGHASPCIVGERIFLASADEPTETQFVICLDRRNGQQLWRVDLHQGKLPPKHEKNSHASATPACDGRFVFLLLANADQLWASAVSVDGKLAWQKSVGGYKHANGYGSSPAMFGQLLIAANDNEIDPSLAALDRLDGHIVWQVKRPTSDNSATPVVAKVAGRPQLLLNGANAVVSYDPATGDEIWSVNHATEVAACTIAFDDLCVYASGNVPDKLMLGIRADGQGDVTDANVLWSTHEANTYVPSPLLCGKLLFVVVDSGTAYCRDARSGEVLWKHRLGGSFFASPVAAGGNVYAANDTGITYVFRAANEFELVAQNDIGESCIATPVFSGDRLYLRTISALYCIGNQP